MAHTKMLLLLVLLACPFAIMVCDLDHWNDSSGEAPMLSDIRFIMDVNALESLEAGNYISFATRKRSGDWVATPVWFAPDEDSYYVFSAGGAGKVKRLRNFTESRIAACTFNGKLTGAWHDTQAVVLDHSEDQDRALAALRRKYGVQMLMGDFFSQLTGKMGRRAYIRIDP